jgi:two-component system sensor histidine kinase BaeS
MKTRLIWKLFAINLLIIALVVLIVWGAVDYLAKGYFMALMDKYHISPKESHQMFVASIHSYLIWGSIAAVIVSSVISLIIMKHILDPLAKMTQLTERIATGEFPDAVPVTTNDEVGQLAQAFNRMTESLSHLEKLRKNMIVDVAHELKTPLTNIQGYLEGLTDKVVEPSEETLSLLKGEAQRLNYLVNDILKLARAGAAQISLDILEINFIDACKHVYGILKLQFNHKNITVDFTGIKPDCQVYADPNKLAQVLHNLFQNGLQYTQVNGRLRIYTEDIAEETRITFANPCNDMQDDDLPLIFERFYRGEKSRSRDYGGAGIGLAVVKDLVEAHKGKVGAELEGGELLVWFTLPNRPRYQATS